MAEPVPFEGLSTRKLVLETAYYNVLTAYTESDLDEVLARFPKIDAVVLHAALTNGDATPTIRKIRSRADGIPIIVLSSKESECAEGATHIITSHDPQVLLATLRKIFGESPTFKH